MLTKNQAKRVAHLIRSYGDLRAGFPKQGKGMVDAKAPRANGLWAGTAADDASEKSPKSTFSLKLDPDTGGYRIVREFKS